MKEKPFEEYCILELMGHRRLAGKVTEASILGGALLRIDIPGKDGNFESTQFYGPQAIYCLTPTTEAIARAVAVQSHPEPISRWELPQLAQAGVQKCRRCGCTETTPCMTTDGPCYWVEPDLCSACASVEAQGDEGG